MNTRKRTLTPNEHLHSILGLGQYDIKLEDQDSDQNPNETNQLYFPVKKRMTNKSHLWSLFDNGNATYYYCTLCVGDQLQGFKKPASSTVAMRHVRRFHIDHPRVQSLLSQNPDLLVSNAGQTSSNGSFSEQNSGANYPDSFNFPRQSPVEIKRPKQIQFESSLSKLLALPNMSIGLAVSEEMREVFQCLDPKMTIPSEVNQAREILYEQASGIKNKLRMELDAVRSSISATIGVWTMNREPFSFSATSYLTLMVHFICEDKLVHRFLGAIQLQQRESVSQAYRRILDDYELDVPDIYRVCVNGTSSIVNAFVNYEENPSPNPSIQSQPKAPNRPNEELKELTKIQFDVSDFEKAANDEDIGHIVNSLTDDQCHPCIAYDLKLVLFNTIKETLIKSEVFQRILGLFTEFQNSQEAMSDLLVVGQAFVPIQKNEWSSWIGALEYYSQHHHLMSHVATQQNWEQLTEKENELLRSYLDVISVFRYSIKTLECSDHPSVSWVYGIIRAINEKLSASGKSQLEPIKEMCIVAVEQMKKLNYVQEDPIFVISTFLDPATKRHLKQADLEKAIELIADWLKVDDAESMMNLGQQEESNSNDPLLQMLDSFGPRQNNLSSLVRSFPELVGSEYQRQPDKGKYSSTTLRILQNAPTSDNRYEGILKIARVVLSVPTSNTCPESEFIRKHHNCRSKEDEDVLEAKLLIHLNNIYMGAQ